MATKKQTTHKKSSSARTAAKKPSSTPQYWFAAKRYGWGWSRALTWQGWLVYLGFIAVVVWYFVWANDRILMGETAGLNDDTFLIVGFCLLMAILLPVLTAICLLKGESLKWRWGRKK